MLLFKKKFLEAIRGGEKTQTIRLWKYCRLRAGQRSYIPGAGYIRITSIEIVELPDLTEDDAKKDGFDTLADLRAEINRLYPEGLTDGAKPYRICFAVLPPNEQVKKKVAKLHSDKVAE
jgi:hypothetical protein